MTAATKAGLASLLDGAARLLFVMAVVAFLLGGTVMREFAKTEWILAEIEGTGFAMLLGGIGAIARTAATCLEERDSIISLSDSLRK